MIAEKITVDGSGKGRDGWFQLQQAHISHGHHLMRP